MKQMKNMKWIREIAFIKFLYGKLKFHPGISSLLLNERIALTEESLDCGLDCSVNAFMCV